MSSYLLDFFLRRTVITDNNRNVNESREEEFKRPYVRISIGRPSDIVISLLNLLTPLNICCKSL